ncbi:MAG: DUF547 domain-containing protein [Putridiphycobacter sp.]|nr:DUF547 domain-containing protein [Putridiphycobacter sp.]
MMKSPLFIFFFVIYTNLAVCQNSFIDLADQFLKQYVTNGLVNYQAIKNEPLKLYEMLNKMAVEDIPEQDKKAYLINAYNIIVVASIVEAYPIQSPTDVPGFFTNESHVLANEMISLNKLEKTLLFDAYKDPRLHFVLVCGAIDCPPLTNFAYRTETLEEQLNQQTKLALNSNFIRVNNTKKTVELSEIFKWYSNDFGGNSKAILAYINTYRSISIPQKYRASYYPYNWSLNDIKIKLESKSESDSIPASNSTNLQTFTAGSLLRKKQYDLTVFNTLYTEAKSNWQGQNLSNFRNTFVTHLFQFTYGVSNNKRINLGIDLNVRYNGTVGNDDAFVNISEAFRFQNSPTSRVGLTSIGLRLKAQPFATVPDFSIQSTLQAPTIRNAEGNAQLYWGDWERITWWNQFFYSKTFHKFQLFTEVDLLFRFKVYETQIGMLDIPINVFFSYFPTTRLTFYGMTQHVPRFTNNINPQVQSDWVIPMNYTASGGGVKYQLSSQMNIELLYTNFWRGKNSGLGNTFNIGIKYISK